VVGAEQHLAAKDLPDRRYRSTEDRATEAGGRHSRGHLDCFVKVVRLELFRSRLALPEAEEVNRPTRPPSTGTIQVAVAAATPVLRKVATDTYFSCEIVCSALLPVICFSSPM
jgi:hypothetical protein